MHPNTPKMDDIIKDAINEAEQENDEIFKQPSPNEEYESLCLGSSIWSTDILKESRQQFVQGLARQNDVISIQKSEMIEVKETSDEEHENDFDTIEK